MKRKNIALIIVCSILILLISISLSLSTQPLSENELQQIIDSAQNKYNIPAVAISVMNSEEVLGSAFAGVRIYGSGDEISKSDYFHIGSCSKAILAYIASNLVEEGIIKWDTGFFELYPDLKTIALKNYSAITLEDLLSCRAGIKPYTSGIEAYPDLECSPNPTSDFIRYLLSLPPSSSPNEAGEFEFLYSNASYTLASAMLEHVSGLSWEALVEKYINQDLGLHAAMGWPYELYPDQPWGHLLGPSGNTPIVVGPDSAYNLNPLIYPAGNLSMTISDFTKFVQLHLKGITDRRGISFPTDIQQMDLEHNGFSNGVWNGTELGKKYICLDGTGGTYYARGVILPESDFGFTIMMNAGSEDAADFITMKLMKAHYHLWWMFWV